MKKIILVFFRVIGSLLFSIGITRLIISNIILEGEHILMGIIKTYIVLLFIIYFLNRDLID